VLFVPFCGYSSFVPFCGISRLPKNVSLFLINSSQQKFRSKKIEISSF